MFECLNCVFNKESLFQYQSISSENFDSCIITQITRYVVTQTTTIVIELN